MTRKKKIVWIVLAAVVCFALLSGCGLLPAASTIGIPAGYVEEAEFFDKQGFQDYTDYCRYVYPESFSLADDPSYHPVDREDIERLQGYFADFRQWMEAGKRLDEYDFDPACIGAGDYVRIVTSEGMPIGDGPSRYGRYDNYSVYFYDVETRTLYYIHSNI